MPNRIAQVVGALWLGLMGPVVGFAQEELRRSTLPGGRASLLGGAFTAVADDPAAAYYNPAGLAFVDDLEVSLSVTALNNSDVTYRKVIGDRDFNESSQSFFPLFSGASYRWGRLGFGYSYMTTNSRNIDQSNQWRDISTEETEANSWNRYYLESHDYLLAGPSLAFRLLDNLSIGWTGYYYQRTLKSMDHQLTHFNNGVVSSLDIKVSTSNTGLWNVWGLLLRFDTFRIGVSGWSAQKIADETTTNLDTVYFDSASSGPQSQSLEVDDEGRAEVNPATYRAGIALTPNKNFLLAVDVLYHQGKENDLGRADLYDTYNYSIGSEIKLGKVFLRSGAFTNYSMYPDLVANKASQPTKIDYIGGSLGFGVDTKTYEGSAGYIYQQGSGESQIIINSGQFQEVEANSRSWVLSARYKL